MIMMIEKVETKTKATVEDLQAYQAEHAPEERVIKADIPDDGYYKDRIHELSRANVQLREKNEKLEIELQKKDSACEEFKARISKLEKALIEATIK